MRKTMPNIAESLDELYTKLHKERKTKVKRRIHMLVLIKESKTRTRKAVAKHLAVHRNTIRDWLNKYESGGFTALLLMKSPGAPGKRSLLKNSTGFGSYVQLQSWLKENHNISINIEKLIGML